MRKRKPLYAIAAFAGMRWSEIEQLDYITYTIAVVEVNVTGFKSNPKLNYTTRGSVQFNLPNLQSIGGKIIIPFDIKTPIGHFCCKPISIRTTPDLKHPTTGGATTPTRELS